MEQEPHAEVTTAQTSLRPLVRLATEYRCEDCGLEAKQTRQDVEILWDPRRGEQEEGIV